ncbi:MULTISPECIES: VOC family protein [unclassified Kribbella]|uniref:VOC family protein n=1 Tax=unclassified Kribbella TaxID=2644121 RepID=UPI003076D4B3
MSYEQMAVTIALPIADRKRSYAFYQAGLGFAAPGEPDEDGVPEPLRLTLGANVRVMLIPKGGFGWVLSERKQAKPGQSECILSLNLPTSADVDDLIARATAAGAEIIREPGEQQWGYDAAFADPDGHVWQIAVAGQFMTTWP